MNLIRNIGKKVGGFVLEKELKSRKRAVVFNNFNSASTIGFIFDAENKNRYAAAKEFMNYVEERGIKVNGLAFVSKSEQIGYLPYRKGVDYFGLDKQNWYGRPADEGIAEFIERPLNILIDISLTKIYPVEYIFALSRAEFKICNNSSKAKYADFVLELDRMDDLELFIEQVKHYLETIETK
ncbi:MAG: hypothetical protein ABFS35_14270 [Bacteroidota bacterium]